MLRFDWSIINVQSIVAKKRGREFRNFAKIIFLCCPSSRTRVIPGQSIKGACCSHWPKIYLLYRRSKENNPCAVGRLVLEVIFSCRRGMCQRSSSSSGTAMSAVELRPELKGTRGNHHQRVKLMKVRLVIQEREILRYGVQGIVVRVCIGSKNFKLSKSAAKRLRIMSVNGADMTAFELDIWSSSWHRVTVQ